MAHIQLALSHTVNKKMKMPDQQLVPKVRPNLLTNLADEKYYPTKISNIAANVTLVSGILVNYLQIHADFPVFRYFHQRALASLLVLLSSKFVNLC